MVIVAPVLIPLATLLLVFLLWAMSQAGQAVIRPLLERVAGWIGSIPLVGGIVGDAIDRAVHWITGKIADAALTAERPVVSFVNHFASVVEGWAFALWYTADRTFHALDVLRHTTIPRLLRAVELEALRAGHGLSKAVRSLERELARDVASLRRQAAAAAAGAAAAVAAAERSLRHAIAVDLPQSLTWTRHRLRDLQRTESHLARRLRRVEKALAAGIGAMLLARLLARLGVPRCRNKNLGKAAGRICGMDPHVLEDLLLGTTLILGGVSLVTFARACQSAVEDVAGGIRSLSRVA